MEQEIYLKLLIIIYLTLALLGLIISSISSNIYAQYVGILMWGSQGSNIGQFVSPVGIDLDSKNNLYVADEGNDRIQVFHMFSDICPRPEKKIVPGVCFVKSWGIQGIGDGEFNNPIDVDIDSTGKAFVVDFGNNRIQVFQFASPCPASTLQVGSGVCFVAKWFSYANHVTIGPQDHIFVTNPDARVEEFQLANPCPSGTTQVNVDVCLVQTWSAYGTGPPYPSVYSIDIAFDYKGNMFVADLIKNHVQIYRLQNSCQNVTMQVATGICYVRNWGHYGSSTGQFKMPVSITVDSNNDVFVSEVNNNRIQKFHIKAPICPHGMVKITKFVCYVTEWGTPANVPPYSIGQFGLPYGMVVDASGRVYVSDKGTSSIQVFER